MPTTGAFNYSNPRVIHWGAGSIAQLGAELQRLEATRIGVVTTRSLVESLGRLRVQPAATVVIGQHAPTAQVRAGTEKAKSAGVDCIVSFGAAARSMRRRSSRSSWRTATVAQSATSRFPRLYP